MYKIPQGTRLTNSCAVIGYPSGHDVAAILTDPLFSARKSYFFHIISSLLTKLAPSRLLESASFSVRVNIHAREKLAYASNGASQRRHSLG